MEAFCAEHGIAHEMCGKVIVAVSESELPALADIFERGQANGVRCEMIDRDRLTELEPHAAGIRAVHVPEAGIVDYRQVCRTLAQLVRQRDGQVLTGALVTDIRRGAGQITVVSDAGEVEAARVINCAGLHSDRVALLTGQRPSAKIVPFRGEYFQLKPEAHHLVRNLIYPVPNPQFPFLGVHFTRMIDGSVECGPNAVLAFAREGYHKWDVNLLDLAESLTYGGFLRLAASYWRIGIGEMWRSISKRAFVRALQRLMPEIDGDHLTTAPAGVRAQAVARNGKLVDDFLIEHHDGVVNVGNAPSPAATSALNIGKTIVEGLAL